MTNTRLNQENINPTPVSLSIDTNLEVYPEIKSTTLSSELADCDFSFRGNELIEMRINYNKSIDFKRMVIASCQCISSGNSMRISNQYSYLQEVGNESQKSRQSYFCDYQLSPQSGETSEDPTSMLKKIELQTFYTHRHAPTSTSIRQLTEVLNTLVEKGLLTADFSSRIISFVKSVRKSETHKLLVDTLREDKVSILKKLIEDEIVDIYSMDFFELAERRQATKCLTYLETLFYGEEAIVDTNIDNNASSLSVEEKPILSQTPVVNLTVPTYPANLNYAPAVQQAVPASTSQLMEQPATVSSNAYMHEAWNQAVSANIPKPVKQKEIVVDSKTDLSNAWNQIVSETAHLSSTNVPPSPQKINQQTNEISALMNVEQGTQANDNHANTEDDFLHEEKHEIDVVKLFEDETASPLFIKDPIGRLFNSGFFNKQEKELFTAATAQTTNSQMPVKVTLGNNAKITRPVPAIRKIPKEAPPARFHLPRGMLKASF